MTAYSGGYCRGCGVSEIQPRSRLAGGIFCVIYAAKRKDICPCHECIVFSCCSEQCNKRDILKTKVIENIMKPIFKEFRK